MTLLPLYLMAIGAYLIASLLIIWPLLGRAISFPRLTTGIAWIAVLLHGSLLFNRLFSNTGVDLHFFFSLSLVSFCVAAICMLVNIFRPVMALGMIVFPLAALLLGGILFVPPPIPTSIDWQIKLHAIIAIVGYSLLSLAALLALTLTLQERALRRHQLMRLLPLLPPLILTETLMFQLIKAGFVLLTLTLLTGALFIENLFTQHLAHKTVLSILAWIIFGGLLWGRWHYGWRGRRATHWISTGVFLLLLAFFGSKFVLELILHKIP